MKTIACRDERGMSTAEYAVGTLAAIAVAGLLLTVVTSGPVEQMVLDVVKKMFELILGKI